ncbi:uncharacterized protein LOC135216821 [Macrobrachium nipponense]|uniref:uncharacterized protein LOC135216821 n=1 Tax=Macrobrachium nipponense TaxID=159736 RepID=UPI0030C84011
MDSWNCLRFRKLPGLANLWMLHLATLLFICCPITISSDDLYDPDSYIHIYNTTSCLNGFPTEVSPCTCMPCWEGRYCQMYRDHYPPRFLLHKATIVVPENITGPVYRSWATDGDLGLTCPLSPGEAARCPCASVTYQLFAAPGDHNFWLHQSTGVLSRNTSGPALVPGHTHTYKIMVQSLPKRERVEDLQYDILDLKVYISPDFVTIIPPT